MIVFYDSRTNRASKSLEKRTQMINKHGADRLTFLDRKMKKKKSGNFAGDGSLTSI